MIGRGTRYGTIVCDLAARDQLDRLLDNDDVDLMVVRARGQEQRGSFSSLLDLQAAINHHLAEHCTDPKPSVCAAEPNDLMEKLRRGFQAVRLVRYLWATYAPARPVLDRPVGRVAAIQARNRLSGLRLAGRPACAASQRCSKCAKSRPG